MPRERREHRRGGTHKGPTHRGPPRTGACLTLETRSITRERPTQGTDPHRRHTDTIPLFYAGWVEDCFGTTLIGAKLDCEDANKHTPLSEAACGGQLEVKKMDQE